MERCPNCDQPNRPGARFCTTCGQKMAGAETGQPIWSAEPASVQPVSPTLVSTESNAANGGWPAAPVINEVAPVPAWAAPPTASATTPAEAPADEANGEELPSIWSAGSTTTWPEEPTALALEPASDPTESEEPPGMDEDLAGTPAEADADIAFARDRATRLLDELREAIAAISREEPLDLSGVISELEVAVTPPGAIGHDDLNELRDALLKARERPRDIDTIVDLTGRIDAMVALVIAYDRTVAAIERSLETLRGDGVIG